MRMFKMVALTAFSACTLAAGAQMQGGPKVDVGAPMEPSKALNTMLGLYESEAVPTAKAMPADKYDFAPTAATFAAGSPEKFETVRSFGHQVVHVALANYYFYSLVGGMDAKAEIATLRKMDTADHVDKEEAVKLFVSSLEFGHKAIGTITAENAFLTIKGADGMNTRASLAAFGVAHGFDHYGQMVEYLRMNGIIPPASAK